MKRHGEPVSLCQNVAHLVPQACPRQRAEAPVLSITPDPAVIDDRVDFFGNPVCYFTVQEPHRELTVSVGTGSGNTLTRCSTLTVSSRCGSWTVK